MSETKLKRCPFCGGKLKADGKRFYVHPVVGCLMDGMPIKNDEESIKRWNTRIPMQNIAERLEEKTVMVATSKEFWNHPQNGEYVEEVVPFQDAIEIVKEEGELDAS